MIFTATPPLQSDGAGATHCAPADTLWLQADSGRPFHTERRRLAKRPQGFCWRRPRGVADDHVGRNGIRFAVSLSMRSTYTTCRRPLFAAALAFLLGAGPAGAAAGPLQGLAVSLAAGDPLTAHRLTDVRKPPSLPPDATPIPGPRVGGAAWIHRSDPWALPRDPVSRLRGWFRADPRGWPRLFGNTILCTLRLSSIAARHWWQ